MTGTAARNNQVFMNFPFGGNYLKRYMPLLTFTVVHCNFVPRCALETPGAGLRETEISKLIHECDFGFHDVSPNSVRTRRRNRGGRLDLPRLNMAYELGRFLEYKSATTQADEVARKTLIVSADADYIDAYFSDIKGRNVRPYRTELEYVQNIRNWLNAFAIDASEACWPAKTISDDYSAFVGDFEELRMAVALHRMDFADLRALMKAFIDTAKLRRLRRA